MESNELISVEQARALIAGSLSRVQPGVRDVLRSGGLAIAEDVFSSLDLPAFDQSSMDGYAIYAADIRNPLVVQNVISAGHRQPEMLKRNQAARIFTGAPLPAGADTIVMQEKTIRDGNQIRITDPDIEPGMHVRRRGSELKKDELILIKGTVITAPVAGLLASLGVNTLSVFPRLVVHVIATGDELQRPGNPLQPGQVYESNNTFLRTALRPYTEKMMSVVYVEDKLELIQQALSSAIGESDLIILTGGVSVGDYDFVRQAADSLGVHCRFHKVKQKPGKPLYFGTWENKIIFGLPGNPASVISCFYEYVLPAVRFMMHLPQEELIEGILKQDYRKVPGLTQFLKAFIEDGEVEILEAQESYRLRSFASANCLLALDENRPAYMKGDTVMVRMLPK